MNDFLSQIQCDELTDTRIAASDWAEYCEYLDSVGYDAEDDDFEEDPDSDRGFQPWNGDNDLTGGFEELTGSDDYDEETPF